MWRCFSGGGLAPGSSFAGTFEVSTCTGSRAAGQQLLDAVQQHPDASRNAGELRDQRNHWLQRRNLRASGRRRPGAGTKTPEGAVAGWTFTAPPGDTITAISMDRDLFDDGPGWLPQIVDAAGTPLPGETCPFNGNSGGCEISGAATHTGLNTTSLTIEVLCSPASEGLTVCGGGSALHSARAELDGATVTITDEQPPQVTSASGLLFTGSLVRGTINGTIDSSDSGSGVQYARLYVDGALLAQQAVLVRLYAAGSMSDELEQPVQPQHERAVERAARDPGGRGRCRRQSDTTRERPDHGGQHQSHRADRRAGRWSRRWDVDQSARDDHLDESQPAGG